MADALLSLGLRTMLGARARFQPCKASIGYGGLRAMLAIVHTQMVMTCPCCGGTAAIMKDGWRCCTVCQRTNWHDDCGHCWDHCRCDPHPLAIALSGVDPYVLLIRANPIFYAPLKGSP